MQISLEISKFSTFNHPIDPHPNPHHPNQNQHTKKRNQKQTTELKWRRLTRDGPIKPEDLLAQP